MTFEQMATEMVEDRFGEGKRGRCQRWLNIRMAMLWAHAEWPFKKAVREACAVDASGNLTVPAALRRVLHLETSTGHIPTYLSNAEYRALVETPLTSSSSEPSYWTQNSGAHGSPGVSIYPPGMTSVRIAYDRRMCHIDAGTIVAGPMDGDNDEPVWDPEFHYVLVSGATATGLKTENDPTWEALEGEWQMGINAMMEEYMPPNLVLNRQYGRIED